MQISYDEAVDKLYRNFNYVYGGGRDFHPAAYAFDSAATLDAAIEHARSMGCDNVAVYERTRINDFVGPARFTPARQVGTVSTVETIIIGPAFNQPDGSR